LRICLTGGNVHDISPAFSLISGLSAKYLLTDKAYDVDNFISLTQFQGSDIVIPPKANLLEQRVYDQYIYKERHLIECFFAKLKKYHRIATRYEKLAQIFRAVAMITAYLAYLIRALSIVPQ